MQGKMILFWRRLDLTALERLELEAGAGGIRASSTLVSIEYSGFQLDYEWLLDGEWRTTSLEMHKYGKSGRQDVRMERAGGGWTVNGEVRSDLNGADEPDLSATPFCNTLPIRRLGAEVGAELTLDTVYVDAADLSVVRSRQRYLRQSRDIIRYIDLGTAAGFEAELVVDADGLVQEYRNLFERVHVTE